MNEAFDAPARPEAVRPEAVPTVIRPMCTVPIPTAVTR